MTINDLSGLMPMLLPAVGGVFILLMIALARDLDLLWHGAAAATFLILMYALR